MFAEEVAGGAYVIYHCWEVEGALHFVNFEAY
jgi:hypothetical protein